MSINPGVGGENAVMAVPAFGSVLLMDAFVMARVSVRMSVPQWALI